jgi:hypothetical protein
MEWTERAQQDAEMLLGPTISSFERSENAFLRAVIPRSHHGIR